VIPDKKVPESRTQRRLSQQLTTIACPYQERPRIRMLSDVTDNFVTIFEFNNNATKGEYLECSVRELYTRVYEDIYIKGNIEDSELR
jgi:hypothetical protein